MSHGARSVFTMSMASDTTLSSGIDLARAWNRVYLQIPSMVSGTDICLQGAYSAAASYMRVMANVVNTATIAANTFTIQSGFSNRIIPIPVEGIQYIKIEYTTATTATSQIFRIICSD